MPIVVEHPDYGEIEFDDSMTPDQIHSAIQKFSGPPRSPFSARPESNVGFETVTPEDIAQGEAESDYAAAEKFAARRRAASQWITQPAAALREVSRRFGNAAVEVPTDILSGGPIKSAEALMGRDYARPTPEGLPAQIVEGAVRGAGEMVPALAGTAVGVPPAAAFGTTMGAGPLAEGDIPGAIIHGAVGAVLPAASSFGAEAGERAAMNLAGRFRVPEQAIGAVQAAGKIAGSQGALDATQILASSPELAELAQTDPEAFAREIAKIAGTNLAFESAHIPGLTREAFGRQPGVVTPELAPRQELGEYKRPERPLTLADYERARQTRDVPREAPKPEPIVEPKPAEAPVNITPAEKPVAEISYVDEQGVPHYKYKGPNAKRESQKTAEQMEKLGYEVPAEKPTRDAWVNSLSDADYKVKFGEATTLTPAVRAGGKLFKVKAHADAAKAAAGDAAALEDILMEKSTQGFVDQNGKFYSRKDAIPIAEELAKKSGTKLPAYNAEVGLTSQVLDAAGLLKHMDEAQTAHVAGVTDAIKALPAVPEGKVRLFNGQGGTEGGGTTGSWWSRNPERAASYGKKVRYVDVDADTFQTAHDKAVNQGSGTSGDAVLPNDVIQNAREVSGEVAPKTHELPEEVQNPKDAAQVKLNTEFLTKAQAEKGKANAPVQKSGPGEILQRQPEEAGAAGSERVGVEQGEQGEKAPGASPEEAKPDVRLNELEAERKRIGYRDAIAKSGGNLDSVLNRIIGTSENPQYRELAKKLKDAGVETKITLEKFDDYRKAQKKAGVEADENINALYEPKTDTITLFDDIQADHEHVILHETVHAVLDSEFAGNAAFREEINRLWQEASEQLGEGHYGLTMPREFLTESLTNPEFQKALGEIKSGPKTLWQKLQAAVGKVLGLKKPTILDEVMRITEPALEARRRVEPERQLELTREPEVAEPVIDVESRPTSLAEALGVPPKPQSPGSFGMRPLGIVPPGVAQAQAGIKTTATRLANARRALGAIFRGGPNRRAMDQGIDAADNMANIMGQQMGKRLRLEEGKSRLNREAAMAIVEANGDKTRLNDFLVQARAGKNLRAQEAVKHAIREWDKLQPLADRTKAILDQQIADEQAAGINTEYREGYIPHIYDMDLLMGAGRPFVIGGKGGGVGTAFKKGRTFETIFDAIEAGYTPKSLDIADLVEHRVKAGQKLINRKEWASSLKSVVDPTNGQPIVADLETRTRGPGGKPYQVAPLGYERRTIIPGEDIAVHEGYSSLFDALTGQSRISGSVPGKLALEATGGLKHGLLLFDTFHVGRILMKELALTGRIGYRKGQTLLEYSDADLSRAVKENLITQEMADYARQNRATATLLLKSGLNVGRIQEALYTSMVRDIPGIGTFNKWVFEKMTRGAMMESALIEFERVKKDFPALSDAEIASKVSRDINQFFGNIGRQGFFKSKTMQDLTRLVFLAPQWFESMARSEAKGFAQGAKGLTYDPVVHQKLLTGTMGKAMVQGVVGTMIATQLLNLFTKGHPTWNNDEEGHKLDAWIPDVTGKTPGFWFSPLSTMAELTHDVMRYARKESGLEAATHIAANKLSPMARAGKMMLLGKDFDGTQVQDTWERAKRAGMALVPAPIPLQPVVKGSGPGQFQRQLTASAGFKTEPAETEVQRIASKADQFLRANKLKREEELYTPTENAFYLQLRRAVRQGDENEAHRAIEKLRYGGGDWKGRDDDAIAKAMERYASRPFTGSKEHEQEFYESLSPKEQALYDKAIEQKAEEATKFGEMFADWIEKHPRKE